MITFASLCFTLGKANGVGDFPKIQGGIQLPPHPRLLILRMTTHPRGFTLHMRIEKSPSKQTETQINSHAN